MKKGCIISLGCLSVFIITVIIIGFFGVKFFLHLQKNSEQFKADCSKLLPIVAECKPDELKKYTTNPDLNYNEFCRYVKKDDDKVEEIGELNLSKYHENHGRFTQEGKSVTKVGVCSVSIKYTSTTRNIAIEFVDKGDGPKINSLNVNMN